MFDHIMTIRRALISVYDKTGVVKFTQALHTLGIELIATSGTLTVLNKHGIRPVIPVSEVTQFPEILNRIKTIHPRVIGGILAKRNDTHHMTELERLGIPTIDIVICNLSPFTEKRHERDGQQIDLDRIDIGGVNLIRAAAKNFQDVVIIVNPDKYDRVLDELQKNGEVSRKTRAKLAVEAFRTTAEYDELLYQYLKETVKA